MKLAACHPSTSVSGSTPDGISGAVNSITNDFLPLSSQP